MKQYTIVYEFIIDEFMISDHAEKEINYNWLHYVKEARKKTKTFEGEAVNQTHENKNKKSPCESDLFKIWWSGKTCLSNAKNVFLFNIAKSLTLACFSWLLFPSNFDFLFRAWREWEKEWNASEPVSQQSASRSEKVN